MYFELDIIPKINNLCHYCSRIDKIITCIQTEARLEHQKKFKIFVSGFQDCILSAGYLRQY